MVPFTELKPVTKFTDRKKAVSRIWAAIQRLLPAPQAANVAPAKVKSKKAPAKEAKPAKAKPSSTERSNKKAEVIAMMKRAKGVTQAEIMDATGWQAHTVCGFVSILGSKGGIEVESTKNADGERTYHIAK